jgi:hypothetical protein
MDDFKKVQDNLSSDVYYSQIIWYKLQEDAIYIVDYNLNELETDLKQQIDKSLDHVAVPVPMPDVNNFDDFYNKVVDKEKKMRLQLDLQTYPNSLIIFNKHNNTTSVILVQKFERDAFLMGEKIGILVSKYDPDYYVMVGEAWVPKSHEIQQRVYKNYQYGDITKLSSHDRTEILTFYAKTKNSINRAPDEYEIYEIIRERQNDEKSRILELRKIDNMILDMNT